MMRAGLQLFGGDVEAARDGVREAVIAFAEVDNSTSLSMALGSLIMLESTTLANPVRAAGLIGAQHRLKDDGGGAPPAFLLVAFFGDPEEKVRAALGDEAFERAQAEGYATTDQMRA